MTWFLFFVFLSGSPTNCGWGESYKYDSKPFLFSLVNHPGWQPVKLSPPGGNGDPDSHQTAIWACSSDGPTFGVGHDLRISNYASSNTESYSLLGSSYSPPSGYGSGSDFAKTFLAGNYHFQPDEVETFYETT